MKYAILRESNGNYSVIAMGEYEYDEWFVMESGLSEAIAKAALKGLRDDAS
jgi:hypothetical protein